MTEKNKITVTYENVDDEWLYVGRAEGFPNLRSFEETEEEAYSMIEDCVEMLKKMSD